MENLLKYALNTKGVILKIYVSLHIYFSLGEYSLIFDTFEHPSYVKIGLIYSNCFSSFFIAKGQGRQPIIILI